MVYYGALAGISKLVHDNRNFIQSVFTLRDSTVVMIIIIKMIIKNTQKTIFSIP